MRPVDTLKVVVLFVGLALWAYGWRTGENAFMYVGIAFALAAFALRFVKPKPPESHPR